jgi:hypothetical protein
LIGKEDTGSEADEEELKFTLGDNDEVLDPEAANRDPLHNPSPDKIPLFRDSPPLLNYG